MKIIHVTLGYPERPAGEIFRMSRYLLMDSLLSFAQIFSFGQYRTSA
jgi:hypothetical protein